MLPWHRHPASSHSYLVAQSTLPPPEREATLASPGGHGGLKSNNSLRPFLPLRTFLGFSILSTNSTSGTSTLILTISPSFQEDFFIFLSCSSVFLKPNLG